MAFKKVGRIEVGVESHVVVNHGQLITGDIPKQIRVAAALGQVPVFVVQPLVKNEHIQADGTWNQLTGGRCQLLHVRKLA